MSICTPDRALLLAAAEARRDGRVLPASVVEPAAASSAAASSDESSIDFEFELSDSEVSPPAAAEAPEEEKQPSDDDDEPECAVCADAIWDPVRLPVCGHAFCRACLYEIIRRGDGRCPLCRSALPLSATEATATMPPWLANAPPVAALERRLSERFPETWERRRAEAELRAASAITLLVGHRGEARTLAAAAASDGRCRFMLFAEVVPPRGWRPRRAGGPSASALLIEMVRVGLPPNGAAWAADAPDGGEAVDGAVHDAPFELRCEAWGVAGTAHATLEVVWKRRLGLPPTTIQHAVELGASAPSGAARHEVRLPEGLTLARFLERQRPVARIGVGSRLERDIFR